MAATGRALDQPATRRSVRRRFAFAAAVIVAALAALAAAAWIAADDRAANAVQRDGVETDARVTTTSTEPSGRGRFPVGSATVTFAVEGQAQEATIYLATRITDVQEGQTVPIVYDPADPSHAEVQGVRSSGRGVPFVPVAFVAAILVGMAVVATRHVLMVRRILASGPWTPVAARIEEVPLEAGKRSGTRVVVRLETPDGIRTMQTVGFNRVDPACEPEAWAVGLGGRRVLVAVPGGAHVVALRRA